MENGTELFLLAALAPQAESTCSYVTKQVFIPSLLIRQA